MHLDSEAWSCRQCGSDCIGGKPDHLVCYQCAADLNPDVLAGMLDRIAASGDDLREVTDHDR